MTLRQFAALAGISNPYLSQIERGLKAPSDQVVDAIARALKTSADDLYAEAGFVVDAEGEDGRARIQAVLEKDSALLPHQRRVLLDVYDALVAAGPAPPPPRRQRQSADR
jgi:transcriptional regulator with XRE-family HTH domain